MASDYTRGEMDIQAQKAMFSGFMTLSVWSSAYILASTLVLTLIFVVGMNWMSAVVIGAVLIGLAGLVLGMKTSWYVWLAVITVLTFITGFLTMFAGYLLSLLG